MAGADDWVIKAAGSSRSQSTRDLLNWYLDRVKSAWHQVAETGADKVPRAIDRINKTAEVASQQAELLREVPEKILGGGQWVGRRATDLKSDVAATQVALVEMVTPLRTQATALGTAQTRQQAALKAVEKLAAEFLPKADALVARADQEDVGDEPNVTGLRVAEAALEHARNLGDELYDQALRLESAERSISTSLPYLTAPEEPDQKMFSANFDALGDAAIRMDMHADKLRTELRGHFQGTPDLDMAFGATDGAKRLQNAHKRLTLRATQRLDELTIRLGTNASTILQRRAEYQKTDIQIAGEYSNTDPVVG